VSDPRTGPLAGTHVDAVVVGAGFAGMYAVHKLRDQLGLEVQAFERGSDVGGTWFWNCYPGARTDGEAMDYSYSFSEELQQEWTWTHRYAVQPDILRYQNHVADRFDLRRSFRFDTTVTAATWDDAANRWTVQTDRGDRVTATYLVMASGVLSHAKKPDFPGFDTFEGEWYQTSAWPRSGVDVAGKRVGIIGTGSTGIQLIPKIAEECAHLTVFQRTANFSVPANNRPLLPEHVESVKARYAEHRASARVSGAGVTEIRDFDEPGYGLAPRPLEATAAMMSPEEQQRQLDWRWGYGGLSEVLGVFGDIMVDETANTVVADYARDVIRRTVTDPETAERLCPTDHPFGSKRLCLDTDYYATYNRENVDLVSIRETPIEEFTPRGIRTSDREYELDTVLFAIGFDALTGALLHVDIRGVGGRTLRQAWKDGPRSYLGLSAHGFPNLFTIVGPLSPSVVSNMVNSIEQHVEWVADAIAWLRDHGLDRIEADEDAQEGWVTHVADIAGGTLYTRANSWYIGANVPGKPRVFLPYLGGVGEYRRACDEVAATGYRGFTVASSGGSATPALTSTDAGV
jgi:cyclohexanone monooxygenase